MPNVHTKPSPQSKGGERVLWIALIVICVLGMALYGAMIPAYLDDPLPLIFMAGVFAAGAFISGARL